MFYFAVTPVTPVTFFDLGYTSYTSYTVLEHYFAQWKLGVEIEKLSLLTGKKGKNYAKIIHFESQIIR